MTAQTFGHRGDYTWFCYPNSTLVDILDAVPELVRDRRVCVAALDGAPVRLLEPEIARGWTMHGALAVSPADADDAGDAGDAGDAMDTLAGFAREEYAEWYVVDGEPPSGEIETFVNLGGFQLAPPTLESGDPTWCRAAARSDFDADTDRLERCWSQILRFRPVSYVVEGDRLSIATRDPVVVARLADRFDARFA